MLFIDILSHASPTTAAPAYEYVAPYTFSQTSRVCSNCLSLSSTHRLHQKSSRWRPHLMSPLQRQLQWLNTRQRHIFPPSQRPLQWPKTWHPHFPSLMQHQLQWSIMWHLQHQKQRTHVLRPHLWLSTSHFHWQCFNLRYVNSCIPLTPVKS